MPVDSDKAAMKFAAASSLNVCFASPDAGSCIPREITAGEADGAIEGDDVLLRVAPDDGVAVGVPVGVGDELRVGLGVDTAETVEILKVGEGEDVIEGVG